jgi:hypothetical protein
MSRQQLVNFECSNDDGRPYRKAVAYPGIFFGGGSTNSVEDRENGDLGAVAP